MLLEKEGILSIFFTSGHPKLEDTGTILKSLEKEGVDLVEIGFPFSDPIADGPTIQESSEQALKNGMTLELLFQQLTTVHTQLPIILMGYLNPVLQFGIERFCEQCQKVGVDGLILPDLPLEVYQSEYANLFEKYNLKNIFLITPQTSEQRIRQIDEASSAFIYMVSSANTTGGQLRVTEQSAYFNRVNAMNLKNPTLIGFGISDNPSFKAACKYSKGAIIGSAFIKEISNSDKLSIDISKFVKGIRG